VQHVGTKYCTRNIAAKKMCDTKSIIQLPKTGNQALPIIFSEVKYVEKRSNKQFEDYKLACRKHEALFFPN